MAFKLADSDPLCLYELLRTQADQTPDSIAIAAPGRSTLTYGALIDRINKLIRLLREKGLDKQDRIAIVLPNGPEMAVAFLGLTAFATSAPLNPTYTEEEFGYYLTDLKVSTLMVQSGVSTPATTAAKARGISVMELSPVMDAPAGTFVFEDGPSESGALEYARAGDTAILLHTSGTTARPKIVPLSQQNICTSALNVKASLKLTPADRCLNIMPLFHIHGLVGALLSSLAAGASVVCTPGFYATRFFQWMKESRPTWYTAVPTMHQAILGQAAANHEVIEACPLRFIRSCSASLPCPLMTELESTFNSPVVEAYGMTEAAHQITSSPLPPLKRKPGSVGISAGNETAIMDHDGEILAAGEIGEIVIRGQSLTAGYERDREANDQAFVDGWFRTGDQGFLDGDGYLFIQDRLKEIIKRGGENISPREIEAVLLDHPAVAQAVAFAVPDRRLGEEIASVVVLEEGASISEQQLREYVAARLAPFKTPRRVLFRDDLPKGPTGKIQRIGLSERLGLRADSFGRAIPAAEHRPFTAPRTAVEESLAAIWTEVLGLEHISTFDNFLDLGGDSMSATMIASRVSRDLLLKLPLLSFFEAPNIAAQAMIIEEAVRSLSEIEQL